MRLFQIFVLLVAGLSVHAQNQYTTLDQLDASQRWLRTPGAGAIHAGDYLLFYQHGGATINQAGNNLGHVSNLNGAGHYDLNQVVRTGGDTVYFALPLTNDYALSATQLIAAPGGNDVSVSGSLSAPAYDGTTGGVLFLAAGERLTVGAELSAAAAGFRGGQGTLADSDCNRFTVADGEVYGAGNWRGSSRGEGVAGVPSAQPLGRAPVANGGGGGNDHNTGGGGGANTAGGGLGARNIVMGLFNNACRGNFPGLAGRSLSPDQDRVFLGGGGGAGHANNTTTANGGNGGGLVVLWAPSVRFVAGGAVDVSGAGPDNVNGDGGGGGGAGGSVLLVADSLFGSPALDLSGGRGADVDNQSDRCFGPGGGGSGGRLLTAAFYRAQWSPNADLARGGFGRRLGSNDCGANDEPAGEGTDGSQQAITFPVPFGGFVQSADTLCADQQLLLTDASNGAQAAGWEIFPNDEALTADVLGLSLRVSFADTARGTFTAVQTLFANGGQVYPGDTAVFTVYPIATAGGADIFFNDEFVTASVDQASGFDAIRFDFGDGTVVDTTATSLDHVYTEGGNYTVAITLLNANCGDLPVTTDSVSLAEFAFADADVKTAAGCAPFALPVTDLSTGAYAGSRWDLPGAETTVVMDSTTIEAVYNDPGTYVGTLTLLGALGPDTTYEFTVTVLPVPTADFTFTVDTATAAFTAITDLADEFSWDFGDGAGTSSEQAPNYTYDSTGTFTVVLTATLGACATEITQEVTIEILSDLTDLHRLNIRLFPNPTTGELFLKGEAELVDVIDLSGRHLGPLSGRTADLSGLPRGHYIVRLKSGGRLFSIKVLRR